MTYHADITPHRRPWLIATPLVVVVLLEEDNARLAQWIGQELIIDAMNP